LKPKDKLAQYGERVFNITGNSRMKSRKAIEKQSNFSTQWEPNFQKTDDYKDTADFIVNVYERVGRSW
jgi:NADP-dependent alcohol dehydrogenase